jgi:hypothetical protein
MQFVSIEIYIMLHLSAEMVLTKKGSFSYSQDIVNYLTITDELVIRIERVDENIARVFLVDAQGVQAPIPAHITMTNSAGNPTPSLFNNFFITWVDSYTLAVNGQPHMLLNNQKQQSISGPSNAASGLV